MGIAGKALAKALAGVIEREALEAAAMKAAARRVVHGLGDIRPPSDDVRGVIQSNFYSGHRIGDDTLPIGELKFGVSQGDSPKRVQSLADQIAAPGGYFSRPIVDQAGNVLEGQHRVSALQSLGVTDVPVTRVMDHYADIDRGKLIDAVKGVGSLHPEHARQVADNLAEMIAKSGGADRVERDFVLNGPWEDNYRAGIAHLTPPPAPSIVTAPAGIRAYHGSPHAFDKFDLNAIGTGEGAQAYGHGLYFAENEQTAKTYRDLADRQNRDRQLKGGGSLPAWIAGRIEAGERPDVYIDMFRQRIKDAHEELKDSIQPWNVQSQIGSMEQVLDNLYKVKGGRALEKPGHMYEVNLGVDPSHLLDWDAPLHQQPEVLAKLQGAGSKHPEDWVPDPNMTGQDYWQSLQGAPADRMKFLTDQPRTFRTQAGELVSEPIGLPGIKYLDQMSRQSGEGTRNFVMFSPETIKIMRRYAVPLAAGAGATGLVGQTMFSGGQQPPPQY